MENRSFQESMDEEIESNRGEVLRTIPCYSEEEAQALAERLVNKETFREAREVLIAWLEKGLCNEDNSEHFYSLIKICWNHVEKLQTEQKEYLEEAQKAQETLVSIQLQLNEIFEVFMTLEMKNIWSNFSQNQIEKIQEMRTDILDFKQNIMKSSLVEEESSGIENVNNEDVQTENVAQKLQSKVGYLTSQLNTAKRKSEDLKTSCKECEKKILDLNSELEKSRKPRGGINLIDNERQKNSDIASQCNSDQIHQNEMHIISIISTFLFDNPGENVDNICSHLRQCSSVEIQYTSVEEIEILMRRYPKIFEESCPTGATQGNKWTCISISQKTLSEFLNE